MRGRKGHESSPGARHHSSGAHGMGDRQERPWRWPPAGELTLGDETTFKLFRTASAEAARFTAPDPLFS